MKPADISLKTAHTLVPESLEKRKPHLFEMLKRKHILLLLEWYDYRIHLGVAQVARKNGWQLNCPKEMKVNEGFMENWQGDGCIALLESKETLDYFWERGIPIIDLGLFNYRRPVPRVVTDNWKIGQLAAEHFRDHGYKEVFALDHGGRVMFRERLEGLQAFMEQDGGKVTVLDNLVRIQPEVIRQMRSLAGKNRNKLEELSQGFFAYEDTMASEMISLCLQNELQVPENVAVLGVDNDDLINSGLALGLSSVDSDQEGLGRAAANLLQSILGNPEKAKEKTVLRHPPKGVNARQSTDCYAVRNPLVSNALHWIHQNFYRGIMATDVAEAMGVTQQGLQKAFAKSYTRSPGQEIRHQRIQAVAHLLGTTKAKLDEIAENCGYNSVSSLVHSFREAYGTTPGKFRKQKQAEHGRDDGTCLAIVENRG